MVLGCESDHPNDPTKEALENGSLSFCLTPRPIIISVQFVVNGRGG